MAEFSVDGATVFAATGGQPFDPGRPGLVLMHGAGMDRTVWFMQARALAHRTGRSVLAVDLPGHGRSGGAALGSIGELADWVGRLLDAAGLERAALAGHSLGALTALEAAARLGPRVDALLLLGVAARMPVHPDLLAAARANDHLAFDLVTSWAHGRPAHVGGHAQPGLWMMGGAVRLLERARPGALHADLKACDDYRGAEEAAARVTAKTALILGDADMMTPAAKAAPLADAIDGARVVVIPSCGHMMMTERPLETAAAMRAIL